MKIDLFADHNICQIRTSRSVFSAFLARLLTFLVLSAGIAGTAVAQNSGSPYYTIKAPADTQQVLSLGSVSISTYSPVTITPTENSTNLYFVVKNQGSQPVTLDLLSWDEILATKPDWLFHFFKFFGFAGGPTNTVLAAGETTTLEFYVSKDVKGGLPLQTTLPFTFQVKETGQQGTLNVTFIGDDQIMQLRRTPTSTIAGRNRIDHWLAGCQRLGQCFGLQ